VKGGRNGKHMNIEGTKEDKEEGLITIQVKTMEYPVLMMNVSPSQSIKSLKQMITEQLNLSGKTIRLISQGKLLDENNTVKTSLLQNNCFIHCAISQHVSIDMDRNTHPNTQPQTMRVGEAPVQSMALPSIARDRTSAESALPHFGYEWEQEDASVETPSCDIFIGLAMGFLLGLIVLFWLWDRNIPRQTKLGIIAGVGLNVIFGLIKISTKQQ